MALVGGDGDGDAEVGVCACCGVFGVVAEGAEDVAGGELEDVGVVDVVGVGGTAGYFAYVLPAARSNVRSSFFVVVPLVICNLIRAFTWQKIEFLEEK